MGDGDASVKHLDPATALSIAGQWRDEFAEQGYLTTDQIGAGLEQATEEYIVIAAGAVNNDGVIDRDEYDTLHEILPYYDPVLEIWRRQSPLLARLELLNEQATRECGNDSGCGEKREEARRGILQGDWRGVRSLSAGERDTAVETLLPWLDDPEVRLHYTPLLESALLLSGLEAALEPLIFNADEDIRGEVVKEFRYPLQNTRLISLARRRLKENPRDQHAFLSLVDDLQFAKDEVPAKQRQLQKLTEKYMRESEMHPEDAFPHWALGHLMVTSSTLETFTEDIERSRALFAKAAELEPANPRYQFDAGADLANAIELLEKAVELDPGNVSYLEQLAQRCLWKDRRGEAISNMLAVADIRPERNLELGSFYLKAGRYDEAIKTFKKYLCLYPNGYPEVLVALSQIHPHEVENIPLSFLSLLEQSLLRLGATRKACYNLAEMYHRLKDFEKAEKYYRLALQCPKQNFHQDWEIYKALGDTLHAGGNDGAAVDAYRKAIELNPRPAAEDYHEFGKFLYDLRRYEEAIEPLKRAMEIDERDLLYLRDRQRARGGELSSQVKGSYLFDLVNAYRASGSHPQEIIDCFVRAGDIVFAEGEYTMAERYYWLAIPDSYDRDSCAYQRDSSAWPLWRWEAAVRERLRLGDIDGVFAALKKMGKRIPRIPGDKRYYKRYYKADLGFIGALRAQRRFDEALEHAERCLRGYTGEYRHAFQLEYDALTEERRGSN